MKISFDLDDTIIPGSKRFPTVRRTSMQKLLRMEPVRSGTIELFRELKQQGHKVGIYTTSFRSWIRIKLLFGYSGFMLDFIINQKQNVHALKKCNIPGSKYPPAFNIDLHIDDSKGVEMEGQRYGFRTVIINENEPDWTSQVHKALWQYRQETSGELKAGNS